jgi:hypothetical protein
MMRLFNNTVSVKSATAIGLDTCLLASKRKNGGKTKKTGEIDELER